MNGIACLSAFVRHCAYWAAASYPPSVLSAAAHAPHSAVVSLPEVTSGWLDAEQRPGLHQCTYKLTHDTQTSVPHHRLRWSPAPRALMVLTPSLCNGRLGTSLPLRKRIFLLFPHLLLFYIRKYLPFQSSLALSWVWRLSNMTPYLSTYLPTYQMAMTLYLVKAWRDSSVSVPVGAGQHGQQTDA